MIAQTAISSREITITEQDFDRLQALLDSPRYRATHSLLLLPWAMS